MRITLGLTVERSSLTKPRTRARLQQRITVKLVMRAPRGNFVNAAPHLIAERAESDYGTPSAILGGEATSKARH